MNANELTQSNVDVTVVTPRVVIVFHPNPRFVDLLVNDRMFNNERYYHSRVREAVGAEKVLLDMCSTSIIGIVEARAAKNKLNLEISDGMLPHEIIPPVLTALKQWGSAIEPYNPEVYVDNRRYDVAPTYSVGECPVQLTEGVRPAPGSLNIGVPYKVWKD